MMGSTGRLLFGVLAVAAFPVLVSGAPQLDEPCVVDGVDVTNAADLRAIEQDLMADMVSVDASLLEGAPEWVQVDNLLKLLRDYAPMSCREDDADAFGAEGVVPPPERRFYIGYDPALQTADGRGPTLTDNPLRVIGSRFQRVVGRDEDPWSLVAYPPDRVDLVRLVETGERATTHPDIPYADRVVDNLAFVELVAVPRIQQVGACYSIETLTLVPRRVFDASFPAAPRATLPTASDSLWVRKETSELTPANLRAWVKDLANLEPQCEIVDGEAVRLLYTPDEVEFLTVLYREEIEDWETFWEDVVPRVERLKRTDVYSEVRAGVPYAASSPGFAID